MPPWFVFGDQGRKATKKAPPPRVIPVVTATAHKSDLGLYLSGLGTVTAFNTVTIRSRVEGELIRVAFTEGQMVEQGQLAGRDRSAAVPGATRPGRRATGQGSGGTQELRNWISPARSRWSDSKAVTQQQVDTQAALVQQNEGRRQKRPGPGRQRQAATDLLPDHGSRSRAASVCAWSIRATWSTPTIRKGWP